MLKGSVDLESYTSVGGHPSTLQAIERRRAAIKTREDLESYLVSLGWDLSFCKCPYSTPLVISTLPDNVLVLPSVVINYDIERYNTTRRPVCLYLSSSAVVDDEQRSVRHESGVVLLWEGRGTRRWTVYLAGRTIVVTSATHRYIRLAQSTDRVLPPYVVAVASSTQHYEEGLVRIGKGLTANRELTITKDDGQVIEWREMMLSSTLLLVLPELDEGLVYNSLYLSWLAGVIKTDWLCTLVETTRDTRGKRLDRSQVHMLTEEEQRELSEVILGKRLTSKWLTSQGL